MGCRARRATSNQSLIPQRTRPPQDVAELCVALLDQPAARDTTFEVGSTVPFSQPWTAEDAAGGAAARDWAPLLAGLKKRVTGKTIDGRYLGTEPEPEVPAASRSAAAATART